MFKRDVRLGSFEDWLRSKNYVYWPADLTWWATYVDPENGVTPYERADLAALRAQYDAERAGVEDYAYTWTGRTWPFAVAARGQSAMLDFARNRVAPGDTLFFYRIETTKHGGGEDPVYYTDEIQLFDARYFQNYYPLKLADGFVSVPLSFADDNQGRQNALFYMDTQTGNQTTINMQPVLPEPQSTAWGVKYNNFFMDNFVGGAAETRNDPFQFETVNSTVFGTEVYKPVVETVWSPDTANPWTRGDAMFTPEQLTLLETINSEPVYVPVDTGAKVSRERAVWMVRDVLQQIVTACGSNATVPDNCTLDWLLLNAVNDSLNYGHPTQHPGHRALFSADIEANRTRALSSVENFASLYRALDVFVRNWAEVAWSLETAAMAASAWYLQFTAAPVVTRRQAMIFFNYIDRFDILKNFGATYNYTRNDYVLIPRGDVVVYGVGGRMFRADVFELCPNVTIQWRKHNAIELASEWDVGKFLVGFMMSLVTAGAGSALFATISEALGAVVQAGVDLTELAVEKTVVDTATEVLTMTPDLIPLGADVTIGTITVDPAIVVDVLPEVVFTPDAVIPIESVDIAPPLFDPNAQYLADVAAAAAQEAADAAANAAAEAWAQQAAQIEAGLTVDTLPVDTLPLEAAPIDYTMPTVAPDVPVTSPDYVNVAVKDVLQEASGALGPDTTPAPAMPSAPVILSPAPPGAQSAGPVASDLTMPAPGATNTPQTAEKAKFPWWLLLLSAATFGS